MEGNIPNDNPFSNSEVNLNGEGTQLEYIFWFLKLAGSTKVWQVNS